jgi:ribosomal protein L11 methyltransferase
MRSLVLTVPGCDAEVAADRLWSCGARAVEERLGRDGLVQLHTVLAADDDVSLVRLGEVPAGWLVGFIDVDPRQAQTWRDHARPVLIAADLVIQPAWLAGDAPPGVTEISIEPGGSFGLGDHPSTRLTAAAVRRLVHTGDRVLDVGCGSGVLAIIAARAGASHVDAIDIAEAAKEASDANVRLNGVSGIVRVSTTGLDAIEQRYDLVLANILAPTLVALAPDLVRVTEADGALVISGVLADRHQHVLDALKPLCAVETDELDGWAAVELRRR